METIEIYKEQFKKRVKMFQEARSLQKKKDIYEAVKNAYKDFTPRTVHLLDKNIDPAKVKEVDEKRKEVLGWLSEEFSNLFRNTPADFDFQKWHHETCESFLDKFDDAIEGVYQEIKYGKAQKIVNMTFKYLYCFGGAEKYNNIFKQCHMPIDSFTLNWYWLEIIKTGYIKSDTGKKILKDQLPNSWSDMTEEQYDAIQKNIEAYLEDGKKQYKISDEGLIPLPSKPFYAEFIIWAEEMKKAAQESMNKVLDKYGEDEVFLNAVQNAVQEKIKNLPHD